MDICMIVCVYVYIVFFWDAISEIEPRFLLSCKNARHLFSSSSTAMVGIHKTQKPKMQTTPSYLAN